MTFSEALELMKQGKIVRRSGWSRHVICMEMKLTSDQKSFSFNTFFQTDYSQWVQYDDRLDAFDILADDWEQVL